MLFGTNGHGVRGKLLDIIKSMYENVRSRVKYNTTINDFSCFLILRQGGSLSPFLFSIDLDDKEKHFILNVFEGIDIDVFCYYILCQKPKKG